MKMRRPCRKVAHFIECESCGYPYSEAEFPDDYDDPIPCDADSIRIARHIVYCLSLEDDLANHFYDCKCLYCR